MKRKLRSRGEVGNHESQSLVERANRTIAEKLFSYQYAKEMTLESGRSREWVQRLPGVLRAINNSVKRVTGKTPIESLKSNSVDINVAKYDRPVGIEEKRLPMGVKVRYLYSDGELEGGNNRRATDPIWSLKTYLIERAMVSPNQPVSYKLSDGAPKRSFVREQLQVVPEDTQLPPGGMLR